MHTLKPLDEEAVRAAARETRRHRSPSRSTSIVGGLGSAVAELLAEELDLRFRSSGSACRTPFRRTLARRITCCKART